MALGSWQKPLVLVRLIGCRVAGPWWHWTEEHQLSPDFWAGLGFLAILRFTCLACKSWWPALTAHHVCDFSSSEHNLFISSWCDPLHGRQMKELCLLGCGSLWNLTVVHLLNDRAKTQNLTAFSSVLPGLTAWRDGSELSLKLVNFSVWKRNLIPQLYSNYLTFPCAMIVSSPWEFLLLTVDYLWQLQYCYYLHWTTPSLSLIYAKK